MLFNLSLSSFLNSTFPKFKPAFITFLISVGSVLINSISSVSVIPASFSCSPLPVIFHLLESLAICLLLQLHEHTFTIDILHETSTSKRIHFEANPSKSQLCEVTMETPAQRRQTAHHNGAASHSEVEGCGRNARGMFWTEAVCLQPAVKCDMNPSDDFVVNLRYRFDDCRFVWWIRNQREIISHTHLLSSLVLTGFCFYLFFISFVFGLSEFILRESIQFLVHFYISGCVALSTTILSRWHFLLHSSHTDPVVSLNIILNGGF